MKLNVTKTVFSIAALFMGVTSGFITPAQKAFVSPAAVVTSNNNVNALQNIQQQRNLELPGAITQGRRSMTSVATMSLFGLGGPELVIILIAAAFLLGPEKLAELGKDAGKIAGELKEVPKEFQKGLAEGEETARAMKASPTEGASVEDAEKKE